jgi:hypothetical protein
MHAYEVRPRKDYRGVDLISDALPFGRLWYAGPNAVANAIGYAEHRSRSHDALIRVYDDAGNVIATHEQTGEFKSRNLGVFDQAISACSVWSGPDNEEPMLSFYPASLLRKSRNRRNRLSSNHS